MCILSSITSLIPLISRPFFVISVHNDTPRSLQSLTLCMQASAVILCIYCIMNENNAAKCGDFVSYISYFSFSITPVVVIFSFNNNINISLVFFHFGMFYIFPLLLFGQSCSQKRRGARKTWPRAGHCFLPSSSQHTLSFKTSFSFFKKTQTFKSSCTLKLRRERVTLSSLFCPAGSWSSHKLPGAYMEQPTNRFKYKHFSKSWAEKAVDR